MEKLGRNWKRVPVAIRKPIVLMVGVAVVATGLAGLALPVLPGWALIFVGFAILATEFTAAERVRDWLIAELKRLMHRGKQTRQRLIHRNKHKRS